MARICNPCPIRIQGKTTQKIEYLYNAAGEKVQKKVTNGANIKTTDYLDGFQYIDGELNFFPHAEGYVRATPTGDITPGAPPTGYAYSYVYNYTDHLGNVRLSYSMDHLTGKLKILEENHYYPFGLRHEVYLTGSKLDFSKNPGDGIEPEPGLPPLLDYVTRMEYQYKYNGKEWQDELGLNSYAYEFRNYDSSLGRWNVVDQLSEKYHTTSPYAFVQNNPILNREIDGRYFDDRNERKAAKVERKAERKADKMDRKADKIDRAGGNSSDLRARAGELRQSAGDIRDMRNDQSTEYRYGQVGSKEAKALGVIGPSTLGTGQNANGDNVVSMFTEKSMGSQLHESRHGGQNARGEINAITQESNLAAEVSAYRAQYSWDGMLSMLTMDSSNHNMMEVQGLTNSATSNYNRTLLNGNIFPPGVTTTSITNIGGITPSVVQSIVEIGTLGGRNIPTQNYLIFIYATLQ